MTTGAVGRPLMNAGARYYGALTLPLYDWAVLHTVVPYAWQCPLAKEQAMYNDNVVGSRRHLDIGVASGYFLQHTTTWGLPQKEAEENHCQPPSVEITLMDLNPNSTKYAAHRLRQMKLFSKVHEVVGDALEPFPLLHQEGEKPQRMWFDSIAMFHLLHCIPGNLREKAVALEHAARVLHPETGVLFGANVTPADYRPTGASVVQDAFAKAVLAFSHRMGALNNQHDSHADMEAILQNGFEEYHLERVGYMTLWKASKPKF